jgi:zinc D-Ala-D-Ala dipeptidase
MKPYHQIPILDCGEQLVPIPLHMFAIEQPHPYQKLLAPYGEKSPYYLRQGVLEQLIRAQKYLQGQRSGWRIQIFDAYRPIAVQQFMVDYTFAQTAQSQGLDLIHLSSDQRQTILDQVYQFWAIPSDNPMTPPPHSTGAAIDITLLDEQGQVVDMGSPIDELSPRSYPNFFAEDFADQTRSHDDRAATFDRNRRLLQEVMLSVGFCQHPNEWWHFSLGDQMWAWFKNRDTMDTMLVARYGGV